MLYASGYAESEMMEGRTLGPLEAYLRKPFDMLDLRNTLEQLLGVEAEGLADSCDVDRPESEPAEVP